jgi:CRP-like cAMP-binding protein
MDAFKYYNFYKEYTYLKKQYKDIIEFSCAEKDIERYIYKKNDCSLHECFGNLKISKHNVDKMYNFYLRMITEIKNNYSNEDYNVEAISKLKSSLINNPMNIAEFGLMINLRQYDMDRLKSFEFLEKINNTNEISNNMIYSCSANNYKKRLSFEEVIELVREDAKNYFPLYDDMDNFKYYNYNEINHLKDGNIFGELALINPSKKRTATIIIKEDCHLGILNKEIYDLSIKTAQHKLRIRSLIFFLQGPIFNGVSNNFFVNNYFFRFHKKVFNCGEVLFHKGEPRTKIYFIIRGELQLRSKMSLKKMSQVIEYLNDGRDSDDGGLTTKYCKENVEFRQFYEQAIKLLKIYVLKDKEISGLDDMVENEIYLFDCVSVSSDGSEVYELDYKIYEEALRERIIRENNDEYVLKKKEILINRLYKQRDSIAKNEYERIKAFTLNPNLDPNNKDKEKTIEYNGNIKSMNYFISLSNTYCNNINISTKFGPSVFEESQIGNNYNTNTSAFQSKQLPCINKRNLTLTSYTEVNKNRSNKKQNQYQVLKTESNEANSIFSMKETKKPVKLKDSSVMTKGRSLAYLPSNIEKNFRNDNNINSYSNISRIASYANNNNMKKTYISLPKNTHKLVRPIQDKLLKSQLKTMKKKITTPNLLMKEFTKKYIEPNIVPCKKGKFKFDNQKIFEPLLKSKGIEIDKNKFFNIAIKQSLKFNQSKNSENNKEGSNQKIKINKGININDLDYENPLSSNRNKIFNISSVRNKKIRDNILDEKFKNYFFIDCLCLDKWEENKNKHLKKAESKLKGKKFIVS